MKLFVFFGLLVVIGNLLCIQSVDVKFDPCCSFPCQNSGVCLSHGWDHFQCDCTGLDYYGELCQTPTWERWAIDTFLPSKTTLNQLFTGAPWIWEIINNIPFLHEIALRYVYLSRGNAVYSPPRYNTGFDYITTESHFNASYYAMSLPPVPKNCPTPMGVVGHEKLPDLDVLAERFFKRTEFKPDPHGTNVLFAFYAQHFSHQFFRTDHKKGPGFYAGKDGVDVSHIYGLENSRQMALRSMRDGKMKVRIIDGEEFPPLVKDTPVEMIYPADFPEEEKVALGHPFFSMLPGLFVMETIWIREHNRVCDILIKEHPEWDDERLYQTAKLIILGENLKITIEDYVQHLSQYKINLIYDPELLQDQTFQFYNRIHVEFAHLYHWHPLMPDTLTIANTTYSIEELMFNNRMVFDHGITAFVEAMTTTPAGAIYWGNHGPTTINVAKQVLQNGRQLRLQSLNNYRVEFGLPKYSDFMDMTGDAFLAEQLEELYGHIDAVEWFTGMMVEKQGDSVTPTTTVSIGGPYAIKGMMANPLSSPHYWKPSTFGGETGFGIVKSASIKNLFCNNMKSNECHNIAFHLPIEEVAGKIEL